MPAALTDAQRDILLAAARPEAARLDEQIASTDPQSPGLAALRMRRKYVKNQIFRWEHPEQARESARRAQARYQDSHATDARDELAAIDDLLPLMQRCARCLRDDLGRDLRDVARRLRYRRNVVAGEANQLHIQPAQQPTPSREARCPRCQSRLVQSHGEAYCLSCGWSRSIAS